MNKPQKYNFGFGWFGPLEACDNGKFYKAEDMDGYIHCVETALNAKSAELREVSHNLIDTKSQLGECRLEVDTLGLTIAEANKKILTLVAENKTLQGEVSDLEQRAQQAELESERLARESASTSDHLRHGLLKKHELSSHNFWLITLLMGVSSIAIVEGILLWN